MNTNDFSIEHRGKRYSKEEVESLPTKTITIELECREWRKLCKYVMFGIWYMNEEIHETHDITKNMRAMLLSSRVRMCKEIREHIISNKRKDAKEFSVTLSLTEWATLRDCIWQGISWVGEHTHTRKRKSFREDVGLKYHDMIMRKEVEAYNSMTDEEELSFFYNTAINFV